jgi:hypothetical protein
MVCESLAQIDAIEQLEAQMLELPQVHCPVLHHFGPGIYIREVRMPAGAFAIGHRQKEDHLNVLLAGKVAMLDDDGIPRVVSAPLMYSGKPGRKVGYIVEDVVWQNIYSTEETDIEKLESRFLDKSNASIEFHQRAFDVRSFLADRDRNDFKHTLDQLGFSEEEVSIVSQDESDQTDFPQESGSKISLRKSPIHGIGVFANFPIGQFEVIGPARLQSKRTPIGRYCNHSANPNSFFVNNDSGDIYLMALKDINGCAGGDSGEEITVDYQQAVKVNQMTLQGEKI